MELTQANVDPVTGSPPRARGLRNFLIVLLVGAASASLSAWLVASLSMPLWVMFTGFIAWYSQPTSRWASVGSLVALWLGMLLAPIVFAATAFVAPVLGPTTLPVSVFVVTALILAMRAAPFVGNILCWFLGFVAFSAAAQGREPNTLVTLIIASAIGGGAAFACQTFSDRFEADHGAV